MSFFREYFKWLLIAISLYFAILLLMALPDVTDKLWDNAAQALVAGATLALAFAAFRTIKNSNEQEKRRREEELARERRQREEYLLNEIRDWALDIFNRTFGGEMGALPGSSAKVKLAIINLNAITVCQNQWFRGKEYIVPIASSLDIELLNSAKHVVDCLDERRKNLLDLKDKPADKLLEGTSLALEKILALAIEQLVNMVAKHKIKILIQ